MLQVYLVRYDCLKIQQLVPSRVFCILFYTICVLDVILLLFSCSFFIVPDQKPDFGMDQQISGTPDGWMTEDQQLLFKQSQIQINVTSNTNDYTSRIQMELQTQDPYLKQESLLYKCKLMNIVPKSHKHHDQLTHGKIDSLCLSFQQQHQFTYENILNQYNCSIDNSGILIHPYIRVQNNIIKDAIIYNYEQLSSIIINNNNDSLVDIMYLYEICMSVNIKDTQIIFIGGCQSISGLTYMKLTPITMHSYTPTVYLRYIDDPYIVGIQQLDNPNYMLLICVLSILFLGVVLIASQLRKRMNQIN